MTRGWAVVVGGLLFALPFLQSGLFETSTHAGPHMDHGAHHGGSLLMLGDHHLEIVERGPALELYVSDSERRPLTPHAASVAFDSDSPRAMDWSGYRFTTELPSRYAWADYSITIDGGPPLTIRLPRGGVAMESNGG